MTTINTNKVKEHLGKKQIYLDVGFWNHLYQELLTISPNKLIDQYRSIVPWIDLIDRSSTHFFTCLDKERFKKLYYDTSDHKSPLFKYIIIHLLNNNASASSVVLDVLDTAFSDSCIQKVEVDQTFRSLLLTENDYSNQAETIGLLEVGVDKLDRGNEAHRFFRDTGPNIRKGESNTWKDLLHNAKVKHNCNSMMIVDDYIIKGDNENDMTKSCDENLFPILKSLLPENSTIPFHLTIFTACEGKTRNDFETFKNEQETNRKTKEEVVNNWKKEKYGFPIEVEMRNSCAVSKDDENGGVKNNNYGNIDYKRYFHDRQIITNHMWISCGGGFDLLNKLTHIEAFYPAIIYHIDHNSDFYWDLINQANYCLFETGQKSVNRLLKYHYGTIKKKGRKLLINTPERLPKRDGVILMDDNSWKSLIEEDVKDGDVVVFELEVSPSTRNSDMNFYKAINVRIMS